MRLTDLARRLGTFSLFLAVWLLAVGCSEPQSGSTEHLESVSSPLFSNDQISFNYFVGKGLTPVQAAGIVGNLDQESNDDPTAVQAGGPGRGVAQWSVGGRWDTDAGDNENAYVGAANIWNLNSQLDFIWYELTTFPGYGLANLQSQTTVSGATIAFMTDFEICGACNSTQRVAYAQAVFNAYGSIPYGASFVSQSFPYASMTLTMTAGQVIPSYIELKNTGSNAWDGNTKIGTTVPRDRPSAFADGTWLAPNRLAAVSGSVPPGGTYKFQFDLAAPMMPGMYDEHFGVVEEGVAWFSDAGQGGPPDNQLEVKIEVVPAPTSSSTSSSGPSTTASSGSGVSTTGPTSGAGGASASASTTGASGTGGSGTGGSSGDRGIHGGCACSTATSASDGAEAWGVGLMLAALWRMRRRQPPMYLV
jgi:MYXO-CTERM domain-containing protein